MSAMGSSPPAPVSTSPPPSGSPAGTTAGAPGSGGMTSPNNQLGGRKKTAWMTHVKATMRAHKGMKLMQVLKMAKKTYKKGMKGGQAILQPAMVGGRRRKSRKTRRSRRGGME